MLFEHIVTLFRIIVIPTVIALVLIFFKTDIMIVRLLLVAFTTPIGLNTIVYPAAYSADVETGASMTVSHLLCVVTLPLMFYFFT